MKENTYRVLVVLLLAGILTAQITILFRMPDLPRIPVVSIDGTVEIESGIIPIAVEVKNDDPLAVTIVR